MIFGKYKKEYAYLMENATKKGHKEGSIKLGYSVIQLLKNGNTKIIKSTDLKNRKTKYPFKR